MKILIISHSVINERTNMGRTLLAQFQNWDSDQIFQLYIHSGIPQNQICESYYSFSDLDALKSIINHRQCGKIYQKEEISKDSLKQDSNLLSSIYVEARKRKLYTYIIRECVWKFSHWYNKKLVSWLTNINPDVIYLVPGDYGFIYDIGYKISKLLNIPMIMSCMDDFFVQETFGETIGGRIWKRYFMKKVKHSVKRIEFIQTICESMSKKYGEIFNKTCFTLYSSAIEHKISFEKNRTKITYIGNLGLGRAEALCEIGRVLLDIKSEKFSEYLEVYSNEKRPEILKLMTEENGIRFKGSISPEQVLDVYQQSILTIHTESFDGRMRDRVKFSVSTKIAEVLSYGPCLVAYGPPDVASITYLKQNKVAYVISQKAKLKSSIVNILHDSTLQEEIIKNARSLAARKHNVEKNKRILREYLQAAVEHNI